MRLLLAVALTSLWCGCVTLRDSSYRADLSSGHIGCEAADIQTTEPVESGMGRIESWDATCKNKNYVCTYRVALGEVACAEKL